MQDYERLEVEWAEFNGLPPEGMVACSSGTAALHLALESLELPAGSGVIVPDYTMVACARAVVLAGLRPTFVGCFRDNLLMDGGAVGRACYKSLATDDHPENTRNEIKAIMAVHVYGRRCGMETLTRRAVGFGAAVVEDLAEAHGIRPHPETNAACWSFYRNKVVAGEEGGAVWFRDPDRAKVARELRCLGFTAEHDYQHRPRGHNYRLSNANAALVRRGLKLYRCSDVTSRDGRRMGTLLTERRRLETEYQRVVPSEYWMPARDVPWVYDLRVPGMTSTKQTELVRALDDAGVAARHGFKPMTWQDEFLSTSWKGTGRTGWVVKTGEWIGESEADRAAREIVYLPLTPGEVTDETVATAGRVLRGVLG